MKKYIKSSADQSKEMTYSEREHLAEEIGDIVSRYLDDDHGSVVYSVSYSQYDLLKYTFRQDQCSHTGGTLTKGVCSSILLAAAKEFLI